MSERWRLRRLHVENRLAELRWKLGPLEDEPLPAWLDHYPTPAEQWRPPKPPVPADQTIIDLGEV